MDCKGLLLVKFILLCAGRMSARDDMCDMSTTANVPEGNMGQSHIFNWIGVLRVHLHDGDTVQVAMTGIVLVKIKYAIGNADDIIRIPQRVLTTDTQAQFFPARNTPYYATPLSYISHPEYEYSTTNTIALIELDTEKTDYPLMPICLPSILFNASSHLYLTGYTDENKYLEKVVYKIHYLEQQACEEFYNRAGLSQKSRQPASYLCGYSPFNKTQCIWDNGMALISNATGWFNLIGFGIRGPGCAAPARFIHIHPYISWINSVILPPEEMMYDSPDYRRQEDSIEYIPAHELFTMNESERRSNIPDGKEDKLHRHYIPYPFDAQKLKFFNVEPYDENAIAVFPFNGTKELYAGACQSVKVLLYKEYFELHAEDGRAGSATYKISLYSLLHSLCVCVIVHVDARKHYEYILSVKEDFSFDEGTEGASEESETPEEIFRYYPINKIKIQKNTTSGSVWKPHEYMKPMFLQQSTKHGKVLNYDLYIKFDFYEGAIVKFEMWSYPEVPTTTSTPSSTYREIQRRKGAKERQKDTKNLHWGYKNIDKRVREPVVTVVQEPAQEIQETVSKGNHNYITITQIILILYLSWLV